MNDSVTPQQIIDFWFSPEVSPHWFDSRPELDRLIQERFESLLMLAAEGRLEDWERSAQGALGLCILLDQFPLNMYRGQPRSFETEQQAVAIAKRTVKAGQDRELTDSQKAFLYMPLMHSESPQDQELSVQLYEAAGLRENARFARHHRDLIRRFGRFPHRNAILGRESTEEELAYLSSPQAFKG